MRKVSRIVFYKSHQVLVECNIARAATVLTQLRFAPFSTARGLVPFPRVIAVSTVDRFLIEQ